MSKMNTIRHIAIGKLDWDEHNQARIERNLFSRDGETWEALRFCKTRDGRHNRVHLVIDEDRFVDLFADAVKSGVFTDAAVSRLRAVLDSGVWSKWTEDKREDPFLAVIGIGSDGHLTENIDEELYGKLVEHNAPGEQNS